MSLVYAPQDGYRNAAMLAVAVLPHVSFLFRDDMDSRITDNFPSLAAAVTESNATLHVGGHP
jgi:hypothetical protein